MATTPVGYGKKRQLVSLVLFLIMLKVVARRTKSMDFPALLWMVVIICMDGMDAVSWGLAVLFVMVNAVHTPFDEKSAPKRRQSKDAE